MERQIPTEVGAAAADAAEVIFQQPNFFGCLEPAPDLAAAASGCGCSGDRARRPHVARRARGARASTAVRWRSEKGRAPAVRPSTAAPLRVLRRAEGVRPPDAGPHRRRDRRRRRTARVRPDAADARAAHPPREGDLEHHDEPDAARACRARDALVARPEGLREVGETCLAFAEYAKERIPLEPAFEAPFVPGDRVQDAAAGARGRSSGARARSASRLRARPRLRGDGRRAARRSHREADTGGRRSAGRRSRRCVGDRAGARLEGCPLIFERSRAGRRAGRVPDYDLPNRSSRRASPRASAASSRARRVRARPPHHGARRPHVRRRHRLLSAGELHDEAQPARQRARRAAGRLPRPASAPGGRGRTGSARAHVAPARGSSRRSPAFRR